MVWSLSGSKLPFVVIINRLPEVNDMIFKRFSTLNSGSPQPLIPITGVSFSNEAMEFLACHFSTSIWLIFGASSVLQTLSRRSRK